MTDTERAPRLKERPGASTIAELLGNPPRAAIVTALMGDVARPASELASIARVSRPTASEHLARLVKHGILTVERVGRNAYFRIAGPQVAELVEALAVIAPVRQPSSLRASRSLAALRDGRTCYRHLAGRIGVQLADALRERELVRPGTNDLEIVVDAWNERKPLGLTAEPAKPGLPPLVKGCLDWSERRHHLAGSLATALTDRLFALEWIVRTHVQHRAVVVTAAGAAGLRGEFGMRLA